MFNRFVTKGLQAKCEELWQTESNYWDEKKSSFSNRCMEQEHELTWATGWQFGSIHSTEFGCPKLESLRQAAPSDTECTVWARLSFLTLVKGLFLACHSEKDKSLAQIPN